MKSQYVNQPNLYSIEITNQSEALIRLKFNANLCTNHNGTQALALRYYNVSHIQKTGPLRLI